VRGHGCPKAPRCPALWAWTASAATRGVGTKCSAVELQSHMEEPTGFEPATTRF